MASSETLSEGRNSAAAALLEPDGFVCGRKSSRQADDVVEDDDGEEEGGVRGEASLVGLMFELLVFKLSKEGKGVVAVGQASSVTSDKSVSVALASFS